jgi:hypothetical protein
MQNRLELAESIEAIITEIKARVIAHYDEKPTRPRIRRSSAAQHYRVALASGSPTNIISMSALNRPIRCSRCWFTVMMS